MKKFNLMLTSIGKWLKNFAKGFNSIGIEQEAAVGRAMGILEEHRKQQRLDTLKNEATHIRKGRRSK